jgi:hypothetical protein
MTEISEGTTIEETTVEENVIDGTTRQGITSDGLTVDGTTIEGTTVPGTTVAGTTRPGTTIQRSSLITQSPTVTTADVAASQNGGRQFLGLPIAAVLVALAVVLAGFLIAVVGWSRTHRPRTLPGSARWRHYAQRSVTLTQSPRGLGYLPCTITPTATELVISERPATTESPQTVESESMPRLADLPRSTFASDRPYMVIPFRESRAIINTSDQPWEQSLDETTGGLAGYRPLLVRFVDGTDARDIRWPSESSVGSSMWGNATSEFRGPQNLRPVFSQAFTVNLSPGPRRVVHYIGTPVPTAAGWRMRVAGALSDATQVASRGRLAGEDLVGADEFAPSPAAVVVLQAEPVQGLPRGLRDLRTGMSALARSIISYHAASGILVVPPLPDIVAAEVTGRIWRFAATPPEAYHPALLFDLVDGVRSVAERAQPPTPTRWSTACPTLDQKPPTRLRTLTTPAYGFHSPEALISRGLAHPERTLGGLCPPLPGRKHP